MNRDASASARSCAPTCPRRYRLNPCAVSGSYRSKGHRNLTVNRRSATCEPNLVGQAGGIMEPTADNEASS